MEKASYNIPGRASLVVQWLRICLQCRGHGFEPWSGKIPHAVEQLGPWATTTEPAHLEPVLHNKRGHDREWPLLAATRESSSTETKTQHSNQSINQLKKKIPGIHPSYIGAIKSQLIWTFFRLYHLIPLSFPHMHGISSWKDIFLNVTSTRA